MASNTPKPVQIREFQLPRGELGRKVLITGIVMLLSARREVIAPGSPLYDYILVHDRRLQTAARWIQNGLFYFLFGAHTIETPIFAWTRLRKHGVPLVAFLKWTLSVFVGGVFVYKQFDDLVAQKTV